MLQNPSYDISKIIFVSLHQSNLIVVCNKLFKLNTNLNISPSSHFPNIKWIWRTENVGRLNTHKASLLNANVMLSLHKHGNKKLHSYFLESTDI